MVKLRTEADVRATLERALQRPVQEGIWAYLVKRRYIEEVMAGERDVARDKEDNPSLVTEYRELEVLPHQQAPEDKPARKVLPAEDELRTLSLLVARGAASLPPVQEFRRRFLDGGVLPIEEMRAWIERQPAYDEAAIDEIEEAEMVQQGQLQDPANGRPVAWTYAMLWLEYVPDMAEFLSGRLAPSRVIIKRVLPIADTALDHLRRVAEFVELRTRWEIPDAVTFVLTGIAPDYPRAIISRKGRNLFFDMPGEVHGILEQVILQVHPSVSPEEVAQLYRESRAATRWHRFLPRKRRADLGGGDAKHAGRPPATLVKFVLDHEDSPWAARFRAWNEAFPQWAYTQVTNMQRDFARAKERADGTAIAKASRAALAAKMGVKPWEIVWPGASPAPSGDLA